MANKTHPSRCHRPPKRIFITANVYRQYKETICIYRPETVALLGGDLRNPFLVTEFRFCEPRRLTNGRLDASYAHINVDHDLMNRIIDDEWVPRGKYILGMWHSHPAGCTRLSVGDAASNEGDETFMLSCLNSDDAHVFGWRHFIAPITTFGPTGEDRIHGWLVSLEFDCSPVPIEVWIRHGRHQVRVDDFDELLTDNRRKTTAVLSPTVSRRSTRKTTVNTAAPPPSALESPSLNDEVSPATTPESSDTPDTETEERGQSAPSVTSGANGDQSTTCSTVASDRNHSSLRTEAVAEARPSDPTRSAHPREAVGGAVPNTQVSAPKRRSTVASYERTKRLLSKG